MLGSVEGALLAVGLLLAFQCCGMCVSRFALPGESAGARILLGSVCGSLMLHWFPVLFAFFLGFTPAAHLWALLLAAFWAGVCLYAFRKGQKDGRFRAGGSSLKLLQLFRRRKFLWVILLVWLFFCALVWRSFLFEDGKIYSSQATYGDMSMHLSFITSIARQGTFPPDYSLLPGFRLCYPFLGDSVSSSLYLCGASLKLSYFLPMALAGAQVLFGFYLFASRMLENGGKGALAWIFFFFNGGFGFLYFLGSRENFSRIFTAFYQTPTNYVEENIRWVNVIVDMMLPQRATLFGWAVLFPALYLLYRAVYEGEKRYFLYAGIFAGLLPMIHTHSFVALALVCGVWLFCALARGLEMEGLAVKVGKLLIAAGLPAMCLLQFLLRRWEKLDCMGLLWFTLAAAGIFLVFLGWLLGKGLRRLGGKRIVKTWGVLFGTACALALPQLCFWTLGQVGDNDMIRGHFGWCVAEDNYLWFYLKNIGLTALLALGGLLAARGREFSKYAPALALWFLAEFVEFQPNDYDNNKLLYAAFAFLCCCAAEFLWGVLRKLKHRKAKAGLASAVLGVCALSAVLTMGREWMAKYELFGEGAIALCGYVEEGTEPDSVILTDTRHNNEIAALSGRNIVCGSSSYLYFHGLPYGRNEHAVGEMYEHPEGALNWYLEMGVDYVLVSDFEKSSYQVDEAALEGMFRKVYDDGVRRLYQTDF